MSIGSPAVFKVLGEYCSKHEIIIPSIRRILMVGAPVPPELHKTFKKVLSPRLTLLRLMEPPKLYLLQTSREAKFYPPLPRQLGWQRNLHVGRPFPGVTVKLIPIHDNICENFSDSMVLESNQIGEKFV